jgi:NodT family efflux transporter outer membrane factor (OMF) lipoprotein
MAAAARLEQARTLVNTAAADRLPRLDFGASAAAGKAENVGPQARDGRDLPAYERYRFGLAASYEIDLFGRVRDSVQAARADSAAAEALFQSLQLALQAEVARSYFLLRQTDAELGVLTEAVQLRRDAVRLLNAQANAGDISDLDLARAEAELQATRTEQIGLSRTRAELSHALAILLGKAPASFTLAPAALAARPPSVPAGLPSTLLERRPDIAAAENRLAAANARIGVAKAAFYPVLNLTADAGFASGDIGELFSWSARTWSLGPLAGALLTAPLFDGGRNRANLKRAEAALQEETATYRQSVLRAVGEVEDALVGLRTLADAALSLDMVTEPVHLDAVREALRKVPDLRAIVNHGATPPIHARAWQPWADGVAALASETRAFCKFSALPEFALPRTNDGLETLLPYAEHLVRCFGPERLLFASNWTCCDRAGDFGSWWTMFHALLDRLHVTADQRRAILGDNALRAYQVPAAVASTC